MGNAHKSSYNKYPNICSDIEVYRVGVTLKVPGKSDGEIRLPIVTKLKRKGAGVHVNHGSK